MLDNSFQTFTRAAALQYKNHSSEMGQKVAELLLNTDIAQAAIKDRESVNPKNNFVIDSHRLLPEMVKNNKQPLLNSLADCYQLLKWRPSGFGRLPPEITNHVAVTEIVGPDGMFNNPQLRFGLLLQDPNITYAKHQHAAEELYFVLNGMASWSVDDDKPIDRAAGEFIHHAENQPHQMITTSHPMLAMWAWLGDIGAESYSI